MPDLPPDCVCSIRVDEMVFFVPRPTAEMVDELYRLVTGPALEAIEALRGHLPARDYEEVWTDTQVEEERGMLFLNMMKWGKLTSDRFLWLCMEGRYPGLTVEDVERLFRLSPSDTANAILLVAPAMLTLWAERMEKTERMPERAAESVRWAAEKVAREYRAELQARLSGGSVSS